MEKYIHFLFLAVKGSQDSYNGLISQEEVLSLQLLFLSSSVSHGWWPTLMERKDHNDVPAYCCPVSWTLVLELENKSSRLRRVFPNRGELHHPNHCLQKGDQCLCPWIWLEEEGLWVLLFAPFGAVSL